MATKKPISFKKPSKGSSVKMKKISVGKLKVSKQKALKVSRVKFSAKKIPNRFGR